MKRRTSVLQINVLKKDQNFNSLFCFFGWVLDRFRWQCGGFFLPIPVSSILIAWNVREDWMPERVRGLPLVDTFLAVFPKKVQIWHYLHDGGLERFKQMPSFETTITDGTGWGQPIQSHLHLSSIFCCEVVVSAGVCWWKCVGRTPFLAALASWPGLCWRGREIDADGCLIDASISSALFPIEKHCRLLLGGLGRTWKNMQQLSLGAVLYMSECDMDGSSLRWRLQLRLESLGLLLRPCRAQGESHFNSSQFVPSSSHGRPFCRFSSFCILISREPLWICAANSFKLI